MNLGKWLGDFVGNWLGAVEELPPGFTSGYAQINLRATGTIHGGVIPAFVSGTAGIALNAIGSLDLVSNTDNHGGGTDSHVNLVKLRESIKRAKEERARLEAEQIDESERIASEVLARIAKAKEPEPSEPVVIPIPEAIEPEQVAQVEPLSPVNDLVSTFAEPLTTLEQSVTTIDDLAIQNENDTIALLLILAEID